MEHSICIEIQGKQVVGSAGVPPLGGTGGNGGGLSVGNGGQTTCPRAVDFGATNVVDRGGDSSDVGGSVPTFAFIADNESSNVGSGVFVGG